MLVFDFSFFLINNTRRNREIEKEKEEREKEFMAPYKIWQLLQNNGPLSRNNQELLEKMANESLLASHLTGLS